MQNSEQIMAMALSLGKPWFIREIKFDKETSRLDIYLSFTKGCKFEMDDGKEVNKALI